MSTREKGTDGEPIPGREQADGLRASPCPMRSNFRDHSANERTYLAWIRTSIGLMAFGFLLEKFTLFLDYLRLALNQPAATQEPATQEPATRLIGLAFLTLGAIMIGMAALRYRLYARQIDTPELEKTNFILLDTILGACLSGAGILLGLYLALRIAL